MSLLVFEDYDLITLSDALDIAEDVTSNFYKYSTGQWKKHPYEVKTLRFLSKEEISESVFALLNKGSMITESFEPKKNNRDFYFICLQDHQILKALKRDKKLSLLPLLTYIFTHELVHIVRFCNFLKSFDASGKEKDKEEKMVHSTTFKILENLSLPRLDYILDSYLDHRICDMGTM